MTRHPSTSNASGRRRRQGVEAPINQIYWKPGYFAKIAILASPKLARNPVLD